MANLDQFPYYLTYQELVNAFRQVSYRRPGWELSMFADPFEGPCLMIKGRTTDFVDPDETVELRIRSLIPPMESVAQFYYWLLWRLTQVESHETREAFWVDGEVFRDPHDPIEI